MFVALQQSTTNKTQMKWNLINCLTFVSSDGTIQYRNRFLPAGDIFRRVVNYGDNFEALLQRSQQGLVDPNIPKMIGPRHLSGTSQVTFELVQFLHRDGVSDSEAKAYFKTMGFSPACITEVLTFVSLFRRSLESDRLVALGSSNEIYLECLQAKRSGLERLFDFFTGKNLPNLSYPIIAGGDDSVVKLVEGGQKKFDRYVYFLAVHWAHLNDSELIDFEISLDQYGDLPKSKDFSEQQIQDSKDDQLYVAGDGHLIGSGVPSLRERSLRHYRPVFK